MTAASESDLLDRLLVTCDSRKISDSHTLSAGHRARWEKIFIFGSVTCLEPIRTAPL